MNEDDRQVFRRPLPVIDIMAEEGGCQELINVLIKDSVIQNNVLEESVYNALLEQPPGILSKETVKNNLDKCLKENRISVNRSSPGTSENEKQKEPIIPLLAETSSNDKKNIADKLLDSLSPAASVNEVSKDIIEEAEDTTDIFDELPVVFIGIYSFDNKELVENFGDKETTPEKLVSLLKRVFQKKYPVSRIYGLPKIPSKKSDKELLIRVLQNYFDSLRVKIIRNRKKHGNSMSLRQLIDQIQHIKILKEHFEEDKETFPYHLFKQFIDNKDYLDFKDDIEQQISKIKIKKNEDNRIRNLLRQFTKMYLLQRTNDEFTLSDPGESKKRFELFKSSFKEKISPPILRDLIDLIEGKTKEIALEKGEDINYDALYNLLIKLSNEFDTIKKEGSTPLEEPTTSFATMKGGEFKFSKGEKIDKSVDLFVHHLFDEYKKLKDSHENSLKEHSGELVAIDLEKDQEIAKLKRKKGECESKFLELDSNITKLSDIIKAKDSEISQLNKLNDELRRKLEEKTSDESNCKEQLNALQAKIDELKLSSTSSSNEKDSLSKTLLAEKEALLRQKQELQDIIDKIRAELELHKARIVKLCSDKKEALAGKTAAEEELTIANARIKALETELASTIPLSKHNEDMDKKEAEIVDLRADIANRVPIKDYEDAKAELSAKQRNIDTKNAQIKKLTDEMKLLKVANAELNAMTTELNKLPNKITEQEVASTKLLERIAVLEAALASGTSENTRISSELKASMAASNALENELKELRKSLAQRNSEKAAALASALAEVQRLNGELGTLLVTNNQLTSARDDLTRERDALRTQLEAITLKSASADKNQKEIERLNGEITIKDAKILEQSNALAAQVSEIASLKEKASQVDVLKGLAQADASTIENLKRELATLTTKCNALIKGQEGISKNEQALIEQLRTARKELEDANRSLGSKDKIYGDTIKNLERQIAELMKTNEGLIRQLADCGQMKQNLARKEAEITALQSKYKRDIESISAISISDLQRLEASYQKEIASQATTIARLQSDYNNALAAKRLVEQERDQLKTSVIDLSAQLASMSSKGQAIYQSFRDSYDDPEPIKKNKISFDPIGVQGTLTRPDSIKIDDLELIIRHQSFLDSYTKFIRSYSKPYTDQYDYKDMYNILKTIYLNINKNNNPLFFTIKSKLNEINSYIKRLEPSLGLDKSTFNNFGSTIQKFGKSGIMKEYTVEVLKLLINLIPDDSLDKVEFQRKLATISTRGGGSKDPLYKYCIQVADDRLDDFLIDEPLPFFELIKSFDKSIIRETNEKYLLELFVEHQLQEHFTSDEMKDFFTQFQLIFDKMEDLPQLCFILYEICNSIKKEDDLDTVRYKSTEYNSSFDKLEQLLKSSSFDFYDTASKQLHNLNIINIKYYDRHIYFKKDTDSFEHTYEIDSHLNLEKAEYDFNEELYTVNNKVVYFFFILSVYNVIKSDIRDLEIVDTLLKHTRTTKRNLKKSAKKLIKEKLDG